MEAFLRGRKSLQQVLIYEPRQSSKGKRHHPWKPRRQGRPKQCGFWGSLHMPEGPGQEPEAGSLVFLIEGLQAGSLMSP